MIGIRDFVPPIVQRLLARWRSRFVETGDRVEDRIFRDYEEASQHTGRGWNDREIIEWVVRGTKEARDAVPGGRASLDPSRRTSNRSGR